MDIESLKGRFYKAAAVTQLALGVGGLASGAFLAARGDFKGLVVLPAVAMIALGCKALNQSPAP